tara:strand:+ start:12805 stop:13764 length:960 start_codon:yes stop_codon:yes gene_type:complete
MTGLEIALMLKAIAAGVQGVSTGAATLQGIDRLSSDEKNRMKELERNQALGLLGLDEAQEQRILNQQLQPVQASLREALDRQQQRGLIDDVGQGATARGEAALLEAQNKSKAAALETARDQITELDQLEKAAQQRELAALQRRQIENRQRLAAGLGQVTGATVSAVGDAAGAGEMAASIRAREAALLKNLAEETGEKALSDSESNEYSEMLGMEQQKPTPTRQELIEGLSSSPESVENQSEQKQKEVPVGTQFVLPYGDGSQNYGYRFTGLDEEGVPQFMLLKLGSLEDLRMVAYSDKKDSTYQEALREYNKFIENESK